MADIRICARTASNHENIESLGDSNLLELMGRLRRIAETLPDEKPVDHVLSALEGHYPGEVSHSRSVQYFYDWCEEESVYKRVCYDKASIDIGEKLFVMAQEGTEITTPTRGGAPSPLTP